MSPCSPNNVSIDTTSQDQIYHIHNGRFDEGIFIDGYIYSGIFADGYATNGFFQNFADGYATNDFHQNGNVNGIFYFSNIYFTGEGLFFDHGTYKGTQYPVNPKAFNTIKANEKIGQGRFLNLKVDSITQSVAAKTSPIPGFGTPFSYPVSPIVGASASKDYHIHNGHFDEGIFNSGDLFNGNFTDGYITNGYFQNNIFYFSDARFTGDGLYFEKGEYKRQSFFTNPKGFYQLDVSEKTGPGRFINPKFESIIQPSVDSFPPSPEYLLDIFNKLQFIIPPGVLQPALNPNFGKNVFDGIMKLLDQFMPFLMLYKFFLPVLNLIICIIEVLCSIPNPFKMVRAMTRLFRNCLPQFLALFPIFAVIIMIISMLILLIALVEYIIQQVAILIKAMIRNIMALNNAVQNANQESILAIAKKLGSMLCMFQNSFVILSFFNILIEALRDILKLTFSIPPCDSSDPSNVDGCCTPDVCPEIVRQPYTRITGTLQYYNTVQQSFAFSDFFNTTLRSESWQIFDNYQNTAQKFINIVDGYDITTYPKPVFFPTDSVYNTSTPVKQAPYLVDVRLFYNPAQWNNRLGAARWIRFNNCIVTNAPNAYYSGYDNGPVDTPNGVLNLIGGSGFEDDGITQLLGFAGDGITPLTSQARIENFLHFPTRTSLAPSLNPTDGYSFSNNVEYTFKPNIEVLINKNLITLGCHPDLALNRTFVNQMFAGDASLKLQELFSFINSDAFPNPNNTLECLNMAMTAVRNDLTISGVNSFQTTINACLNKLKDDANNSLLALISIGFDACNSTFSATPISQFTSTSIKISVSIRDRNQINLTGGLTTDAAENIANRIVGYPTFGKLSKFSYDGSQFFTADLTSDKAGSGQLMISFDNNIFCINTLPVDINIPPTHALQAVSYEFIHTLDNINVVNRAIGDESDGQAPRRDATDLADEGGSK